MAVVEPTSVEPRLTRKGQATRDRIVAVAAQLIFERGVAGTSTDDVQTAAGVSASQLYHYFADKKALVRAVIAFLTRTVLDRQQPLLGRLDTMEGLEAYRDGLVDYQRLQQCVGGCPIGTLASELSDTWPEARADLAAGFGEWEAGIRDGLRAMHDRGDLVPDADPDTLALALLTAIQGGLLLTQTRRDTLALEAGIDAVLAHIRSLTTTRD